MIVSLSAANHRLCSAFLLNFIVHHMHSAQLPSSLTPPHTHCLYIHHSVYWRLVYLKAHTVNTA